MYGLQPGDRWRENESHPFGSGSYRRHGDSDKTEQDDNQSLPPAVVICVLGLVGVLLIAGLIALVKRRRPHRGHEVTRSRGDATTLPHQQNSTFLQVVYDLFVVGLHGV